MAFEHHTKYTEKLPYYIETVNLETTLEVADIRKVEIDVRKREVLEKRKTEKKEQRCRTRGVRDNQF